MKFNSQPINIPKKSQPFNSTPGGSYSKIPNSTHDDPTKKGMNSTPGVSF